MAGLLDGVLPYVYSQSNRLKRHVSGLLDDPLGTLAQTAGNIQDQRREMNLLDAQAFADKGQPFKVTDKQALGQMIDKTMAGPMGFAPVGMIKHLPSSSSLATPPSPSADVMRQFGRVESVPLDWARGTQTKMDWDGFRAGKTPGPLVKGYADKPVAVRREDGEYLIFDGHHRTADAINKGSNSLDMYVVDARAYAPDAAGRKPVSLDADELLRELLR